MAELWFFGGVGEIGGNKILVSGKDGVILLDFGLSLKRKREYLIGHGVERVSRILRNYLLTGILPRIGGIYRRDLAEGEALLEDVRRVEVNGCVISHAHLDHYGSAGFLNPEIQLAVSRSMKALIEHSIVTTARPGVEREIFSLKDRLGEELKRKEGKKRGVEEIERPTIIFEERKRIPVLPFDVTPYPVDHSIPAAFGFVAEVEGVRLAYTGDIRLHGAVSEFTERFMEAAEGVDFLLIEGTRINDSTVKTEEEVKEDVVREAARKEGRLIAAMISSLDIDRVRTMVEAAKECGRTPILCPRLFHLIATLEKAETKVKLPDKEDLRVYFERRSLIDGGYFLGSDYYRGWLRSLYGRLVGGDVLVKAEEIGRRQGEYMLIFSGLHYIAELAEIHPHPGSLLIESTSEPHDEEQEIEWEKASRWVSLLRMDERRIHASGHANREDLLKIIEITRPKALIPIHTEHPREYKKLLEGEGVKIIIPEEGGRLTLT